MQFASSLIWLRRLVVVGSAVACAAASAVGASASLTVAAPDVVERYAATRDPNSATAPDVLERYVTAHSLGLATVVPAVATARIVDDWYAICQAGRETIGLRSAAGSWTTGSAMLRPS